jgi:hypothetical protein
MITNWAKSIEQKTNYYIQSIYTYQTEQLEKLKHHQMKPTEAEQL